MSRFCQKHLPERTTEEIREFLRQAREALKPLDSRTPSAKAYIRRIGVCTQELKKRGENEVR